VTITAVTPPGWDAPFPGFSQGIVVELGTHRIVHVAGQIALRDGAIVGDGDVALQAEVCYERIAEVISAAGGTMADLVETQTFIVDISRLSEVAAIRSRHLAEPPPVSTAVEVTALALPGALIEISGTAVIASGS
jgi:enamine deaminase RidA (YjgF/YER057c/UK114 family)